jgi:flagellar basal body P-ring formation protein FlgA
MPGTEIRPRSLVATAAAVLCLAPQWVGAGADAPTQWQPPESIRAAAERFVASRFDVSADAVVEAVAVDARLKLPRCGSELNSVAERSLANGRGTITVSCAGPKPWRLFVPIQVSELAVVVVLRRDVQRDAVLTADDVELQSRRSTSLPFQYLTRIEDAAGFKMRRTLTAGSVLVPAALERSRFIARGAVVTLIASGHGVEVSIEGIAVEDAGLNQRIRVRTPAGRVVSGVVEAANRVRVGG